MGGHQSEDGRELDGLLREVEVDVGGMKQRSDVVEKPRDPVAREGNEPLPLQFGEPD
ncbi:hypothetical protein QF031_002156 [Pseudarthrobacter defluvii]|nr:hypothetical protein [Pseudarthrobacter defluvii]MDQ0769407.1 hypothetical protein [Pseudarthrobacter defluvii]